MDNRQPRLMMMMMTMMMLLGAMAAGHIHAELTGRAHVTGRREVQRSHTGYVYERDGNTIPAAPVQGQSNSCSLDLSDELLGGVKAACMNGPLDKKHCCPVLAAWLMAARAKIALHPPLQQEPGMPVLPDDSLVCIDSLKAALAERGIFIDMPMQSSPSNSSAICDVVTCFCGIHLSLLTSQTCPLPFNSAVAQNSSSLAENNSSQAQPTLPHIVQHNSKPNQQGHSPNQAKFSPNRQKITVNKLNYKQNEPGSKPNYKHNELLRSNLTIRTSKDVPLQPAQNDTAILNVPMSTPPALVTPEGEGSANLLQRLAANCTDHSYRGCTRCLMTLTKEMQSQAAKGIIRGSNGKAKECELIGLMYLLDLNKTLYIPTVSAVVRALLYSSDHPNNTKCSLDADNMPLALDYSELLSSSTTASQHLISPSLITLLISIHVALATHFRLLL